jgi:hypothetical protein
MLIRIECKLVREVLLPNNTLYITLVESISLTLAFFFGKLFHSGLPNAIFKKNIFYIKTSHITAVCLVPLSSYHR